jgi:DHA1 family inner membrane transport protein
MAAVFGGIALATVVGVPLGTWVAQFGGWRTGFGGIVALGLVCLPAIALLVPRVPAQPAAGLLVQSKAALALPVLTILAVAMLVMGGQFSALTYITPYLKTVSGVSDKSIALYLLAYGIASAAGMFAGGRFADRGANRTLLGANILLVAILAGVLALGQEPAAMGALMIAWGFVGFSMVPSIQVLAVGLAGEGGDVAASLSASAINAGIAAGSMLGGWVLAAHGPAAAVLAAASLCAAALPVAWFALRLRARAVA